jgi:hypothetical protein
VKVLVGEVGFGQHKGRQLAFTASLLMQHRLCVDCVLAEASDESVLSGARISNLALHMLHHVSTKITYCGFVMG